MSPQAIAAVLAESAVRTLVQVESFSAATGERVMPEHLAEAIANNGVAVLAVADEGTPASDQQQLFDLFDAAANLQCDVSLWDRHQPGASAALRAWASSRSLPVESRGSEYPVIAVASGHYSVSVYTVAP